MKSVFSILSAGRVFRGYFLRTAFLAAIAAALLAAPVFTNAQNSRKPTAKIAKPLKNEAEPSGASADVLTTAPVPSTNLPQSVPAIPVIQTTTTTWTPLGPAPIPNGQTEPADASGISLTQAPVSGRTTAIAIDPADPDTAYVGTAQGGLYQTRNGGLTWTALMDNALSLAIGSVELDPTDATGNTLLVGTGEANFSGDSYAGFGVYKITNAKTSPVLTGPFNQNTALADVFSKRGIPGLAIDSNNHDSVYVGTATAQQGIGPQAFTGAPLRGLFHSTNFFSGASTFTKIAIGAIPASADARVTSIIFEPGSSDHMFVTIADPIGLGIGGIYFTTNASALSPTFTQVLMTAVADFAPVKLAINKVGHKVTVVAVTGETAGKAGQGKAYKATYDPSKVNPPKLTFHELNAARGFAGGQGFYNLAVAIDPTNAFNIYIAGTVPNGIFEFSRDGGGSFTTSQNTLHADSHMIAVAPSDSSVIYTGNDGGVWQSLDAGLDWIDRNTTTYSATQFQSVAVHPTDPKFSIGGTQDNGTEFLHSDGTWSRADFGDGGYALIDQTAADTENVTMYHTYFNATNDLIGFARVLKASCATEGQWSFKGIYGGSVDPTVHCDGTTDTFNGISISDPVNFYAPMALGPVVNGGLGQTVYFGTNKLYRSINRGDSMTVVSQTFTSHVSAIGISRTNDNVRLVGLNSGKVFATIGGGNPMIDVTGVGMPAKYNARAVIDPNDANTAYVVFNGNGILGKHVWQTTNLNNTGTGTVTWTAIDGTGIPDVSVNAFVVDPADSSHLYAGTDRGVYNSSDGGAIWNLYGTGLPDVAVFDLAIQNSAHRLRASTHGRGFYEIATAP